MRICWNCYINDTWWWDNGMRWNLCQGSDARQTMETLVLYYYYIPIPNSTYIYRVNCIFYIGRICVRCETYLCTSRQRDRVWSWDLMMIIWRCLPISGLLRSKSSLSTHSRLPTGPTIQLWPEVGCSLSAESLAPAPPWHPGQSPQAQLHLNVWDGRDETSLQSGRQAGSQQADCLLHSPGHRRTAGKCN